MKVEFKLEESDYRDFLAAFHERKLPVRNWIIIYLCILGCLLLFVTNKVAACGVSPVFFAIVFGYERWDARHRRSLALRNFREELSEHFCEPRSLEIDGQWLIHSSEGFQSRMLASKLKKGESETCYYIDSVYGTMWILPKRTPGSKELIGRLRVDSKETSSMLH